MTVNTLELYLNYGIVFNTCFLFYAFCFYLFYILPQPLTTSLFSSENDYRMFIKTDFPVINAYAYIYT